MASLSIGRIAVGRHDEPPLVVPVNYVLDGEVIVFRSDPGSKLSALSQHPISFQVDFVDPFHRTGWSVLVSGVACAANQREIDHLIVEPWAGGAKRHWVRVLPSVVTGRRIRLPEIQRDSRCYL